MSQDRMSVDMRRGWCPGALRPMPTKDGLLVRLKISGGVLSVERAHRIAELARTCGNGQIDLSSRGNLQLRGVTQANLPALHAGLGSLDLLDRDADAEAVRNVLASPLAGLRGHAPLDIAPLVAALEQRLAADKKLHRLPAKFGFVVDDGSILDLDECAADIRFALIDAASPRFGIGLGGTSATAAWIGTCTRDDLVVTAARLAAAFLALADEAPHRMRDLVALRGADIIAANAGVAFEPSPPRRTRRQLQPIGAIRCETAIPVFGLGVAFGRLDAGMLDLAAVVAGEAGHGEIRLTPWRALLIPGLDDAQARPWRARLAAAGFILAPDDPRRAIAACAGITGCDKATTDIQADALHLAHTLTTADVALHLSGCSKGCAHAAATPFTLVGRDSRYDLILNGAAGDAPFIKGLSLASAEAHIAARLARAAVPA